MPTPFDLAQQHADSRERAATDRLAGMLRVMEWNRQMEGVVRSIEAADRRGCGMVFEVSNLTNRITARPAHEVEHGTAVVFDFDTGSTYRRTIRLTEPKE